ncbi:MAG: hypothetical protein K6G30_07735 [Acetatifactor sp.]|nr:hypothetical protein [Acetatifactor sp.]
MMCWWRNIKRQNDNGKGERSMETPRIQYLDHPALEPKEGCPWADTMVLNPAIMRDPKPESQALHMLFRATGPWFQKNLKGKSNPYPIFLGYAKSLDGGKNWMADFSRPALAPALEYDMEKMYIRDDSGQLAVNYANGCVEDPRIFSLDGQWYLTVAGRMFPPGPYWEGNKRMDNLPDWAMYPDNPFGTTAYRNDTTTVLYRLFPEKLISGDYSEAFSYVCRLTDGNITDNRDVFFFPRKMKIAGKLQYLMLHRPAQPYRFDAGKGVYKPSIFLASAENLKDFAEGKCTNKLLVKGEFDWEDERVGASFPPIELEKGQWLLSYHGKQLPDFGYTQSFMILEEQENDFPRIIHRCPTRLMYAKQDWELPDKFACPCIFTTGGVVLGEKLIMSYGAADQKVGIAWVNLKELVDYVKKFDEHGKEMTENEI